VHGRLFLLGDFALGLCWVTVGDDSAQERGHAKLVEALRDLVFRTAGASRTRLLLERDLAQFHPFYRRFDLPGVDGVSWQLFRVGNTTSRCCSIRLVRAASVALTGSVVELKRRRRAKTDERLEQKR
jgi:hypothetical protein